MRDRYGLTLQLNFIHHIVASKELTLERSYSKPYRNAFIKTRPGFLFHAYTRFIWHATYYFTTQPLAYLGGGPFGDGPGPPFEPSTCLQAQFDMQRIKKLFCPKSMA